MPHRIHHVLETVLTAGASIMLASSATLLTTENTSTPEQNELKLFLLPFLGSVCVASFMILMNPNPDTRRITIGRAGFGLFFGVLIPQIIGMFHPGLLELSLRPAVLVLTGGVISGVVYVLSKPFTAGMYERAEGVAKRELDRLEEKHFPTKPTEPNL